MAGSLSSPGLFPEAPLFPAPARQALVVLLGITLVLLAYRGFELSSSANRPLDLLPDFPVDLNRATLAELELLPGIGPTLSQRLVAFRQERGGFRCASDLLEVHGIGPILFEQLEPRVCIGPLAEVSEAASPPVAFVGKPTCPEGTRFDPNRASLEQLLQLPGIGPTLAARIVASRAALPFRTVDDLRRVKGIGAKTLESIRPFLQIDP